MTIKTKKKILKKRKSKCKSLKKKLEIVGGAKRNKNGNENENENENEKKKRAKKKSGNLPEDLPELSGTLLAYEQSANLENKSTQNAFEFIFNSTQDAYEKAAETEIPGFFSKINEDGGYNLLKQVTGDEIDEYKPIRPFVLSAHSSGKVDDISGIKEWKNELDIPIYIVLFSENKMCGITHYDNILTERIRGTNKNKPEITPGYKEVFEIYNREKNSKYKDIMGEYFKEVLYYEQPEVNPKLQEPYVIPPGESVLLAVDFFGGFSESEPQGWLADVFEQDAKKEPSLLIDERYEPNSNVKKISFTDVLNKLVGKIRSLSVKDKPNSAILFMGCCRGIGGLIE